MASVMKQRDRGKAVVQHVNPSLPVFIFLSPLPLMQGGQDVERESVDRRRYSQDQNSWTQLDTVQRVQGTSAGFT